MARSYKIKKRSSKRLFTNTARRTNRKNRRSVSSRMRGGYRL